MGYWKYIPGFDKYLVSTDGEVVSEHFGKFKTLKPCRHKHGYPMVSLQRPEGGVGNAVSRTVHEIVLTTFRGPKKPGQECRHLDGNEKNPNLSNLVWGTTFENAADRVRHGTATGGSLPGEKNPTSLLTDDAVRDIRSSPLTAVALGKKYNVHKTTVQLVRTGKTWRHVRD